MSIEFMQDNIGWIKDILIVIFTGTITLIALLTFFRAKETILQPIRSEVIKKQSELLTKLLEFISKDESMSGPDYVSLVNVNVYKVMDKYGFVIKEQNKVMKYINELIEGFVFCGKDKVIHDMEVIQPFPTSRSTNDEDRTQHERGKKEYEEAKAGRIELDRIFLTKKHREYMKSLSTYADSPFLPNNIQHVVRKIRDDVNSNVMITMKATLEDFCHALFHRQVATEGGWKGEISAVGVYNDFNHRRINHRLDVIKLSSEIRKYLKIDTMP